MLTDFDGEKREGTNEYRFDWKKVGDYFVNFAKLYEFYKDAGGRESRAKFGITLKANSVFASTKQINNTTVVVRVGLKIPTKSPQTPPYDTDGLEP